ncbi:hypothetical protein AMR41_29420 [Hapalosiphon sp. MRB220]|nr:hypothetical protein AMR41_29420 [Hapalosiphon sp. MRB220]
MVETPEITPIRSTSDFLMLVDIYVGAKIKKAEEVASNFTSQNDYSIAIKKVIHYMRFLAF